MCWFVYTNPLKRSYMVNSLHTAALCVKTFESLAIHNKLYLSQFKITQNRSSRGKTNRVKTLYVILDET